MVRFKVVKGSHLLLGFAVVVLLAVIAFIALQGGVALPSAETAAPDAEMGGGVRLSRNGGWAWLAPDDAGAGLTIVAESADMEAARELCDFYGSELARLMEKD